ncbi:MAG TPA: BrxA/BrxB family bacilliredoxin [Terriglobia bacterium]|jgi:putative YphP/YqiW family bacilliredoxin|nr:BrxA/BrxB family bacilliredoxin [Terriglobia bacterium]
MTMYPEEMVQPMREELVRLGFRELRTPEEVDSLLAHRRGSVLVVVNSICGCAAGKARPAVALALEHPVRPDTLATVFAGQDTEATAQARSYFEGYPPSSPQIALLLDGKLVFMLERRDIEGRDAYSIAEDLTSAFDRFCTKASSAVEG